MAKSRIGPVLAAALLSLSAAGCAKDVAVPRTPVFSFAQQPAFQLQGTGVIIENDFVPQAPLPSVPEADRVTPAEIATAWAHDRLNVTGSVGRVVMHIRDARVVEEPLDAKHGLIGRWAGEQDRQFTGRIKVDLLIYGGPKETGPGRVSAAVTASRPIAAKTGPNGAEADYYALLQTLAHDFDAALSAQMTTYLNQK